MKSLGHFFLILLMCLLTVATFASCGDDDDDDSDAVSDDDTADDDTVDDDTSDDDDDDDTVTDDDTVDDDDDDTTDDDDDTSDDDTADDDTTDDDTGDDDTEPVFADEFRAVEMGSASPALKIAAHACQGLYNDELGGSVYTLSNSTDPIWLDELELEPVETISAADFVAECAAQYPCVKYDYTQQGLIPAVITAGVALRAVPVDLNMAVSCDNPAFDAAATFETLNTRYLATKYVYDNYIDETRGLAMLNPGYSTSEFPYWDPPITSETSPTTVDWAYSAHLFVSFLVNGCVDGNEESDLLDDIVNKSPWTGLVGVYGYASYWLVAGGYLYEAQTRCLDSANMGAIPTGTTNLSFWNTRRLPITEPGFVDSNELEDIAYDPEKTYVAFIIGDGDNVRFIFDARRSWMRDRLTTCADPEGACPPLTWSISPHLHELAPDVLEWYFERALETGHDYFTLPPSGHLYAYPGALADDMQDVFVTETENDARLLNVGGTVHWEWFNGWDRAENVFLPKYAENEVVQGIFPVNVPYMFNITTWDDIDEDIFFKIIEGGDGGRVVMFRPREWRGINNSGDGTWTEKYFIDTDRMAAELSGYPKGTVTVIYTTSDGGLSLQNAFIPLSKKLPEHVVLVSADTATRLALEASEANSAD